MRYILYKNKRYRILRDSEIIEKGDLISDTIFTVPAQASIGMTVEEAHSNWSDHSWKFIRKCEIPYKRIIKNLINKE